MQRRDRFDPYAEPSAAPATPEEASERLRKGNEAFIGKSPPPKNIVRQRPFAIVLGCSDARVPTEIVFNQPRNDLFIVRVAGNVLGRLMRFRSRRCWSASELLPQPASDRHICR